MEGEKQPTERELKYSSARAQVLHLMCREAWGNAGNDDLESPTGAFWRISNDEPDVPELEDAFGTEMAQLQVPVAEVIGHYLVTESQAGVVTVYPYETAAELLDDYLPMYDRYDEWRSSGGGE